MTLPGRAVRSRRWDRGLESALLAQITDGMVPVQEMRHRFERHDGGVCTCAPRSRWHRARAWLAARIAP